MAGRIGRRSLKRELKLTSDLAASSLKKTGLTFQELLFRLQGFWAERGCVLQQPYDVEVGAGTIHKSDYILHYLADAVGSMQ